MFWKLYFWVLFIIGVISYGFWFATESLAFLDGINVISDAIALLALYGYAYKRKFLLPRLWKLYFPLKLIWEPLYSVLIPIWQTEYPAIDYLTSFLIHSAFSIPLYVAIYKYAFVDSKYTQTQLTFRRQMKKVKKTDSPYEISRNGNPFLKK